MFRFPDPRGGITLLARYAADVRRTGPIATIGARSSRAMGAGASVDDVAQGIRSCGEAYGAYADRAVALGVDGGYLAAHSDTLGELEASGDHRRVLEGKLAKAEKRLLRRAEMQRRRAIEDALAIVDEDVQQYGLTWEKIRGAEKADLVRLAAVVDALPLVPGCDRQPSLEDAPDPRDSEYLLILNEAFEAVDDRLLEDAARLAADVGLEFKAGPPKKDSRAMEKARLAYGNDYSRLKDLRRASVVCGTVQSATGFVEKAAGGLRICRAKNRFRLDYDASQSGGFRAGARVPRKVSACILIL